MTRIVEVNLFKYLYVGPTIEHVCTVSCFLQKLYYSGDKSTLAAPLLVQRLKLYDRMICNRFISTMIMFTDRVSGIGRSD